MTPATNYKKLLKIIYLLFKSGFNPTVKDATEKTPQDLAVISGFTLGAALLGKTEQIIKIVRIFFNSKLDCRIAAGDMESQYHGS